jgi:hypothetical protein
MKTTWSPGDKAMPMMPMNPILATQITLAMSQVWNLVCIGPWDEISLRAILSGPKKAKVFDRTYTVNEFPDVGMRKAAFEADAIRLNRLGYNAYIVLNRIHANIDGTRAVRDEDIISRRLLFIDVDRAAKANCPATIAEIDQCLMVAKSVRDFLALYGLTSSCGALSGNGFHLYYRLADLPNDVAIRQTIKSILVGLATRFDTQFARIDTAVFNASRIAKLPGTFAFKGIASPGREYRMAMMLEPAPTEAVSASDLQNVANFLGSGMKRKSTSTKTNNLVRSPEPDTPRRRARLQDALRFISAAIDRNDWRDIVWAILSTGWPDAQHIAETWSKSAPDMFTDAAFANVVASHDPLRPDGPTLGTIFHYARKGGWNG